MRCRARRGFKRCRLLGFHVLSEAHHIDSDGWSWGVKGRELPTDGELDRIDLLRTQGSSLNNALEAVFQTRLAHQEVRRLILKITVIVVLAAALVAAVTLL